MAKTMYRAEPVPSGLTGEARLSRRVAAGEGAVMEFSRGQIIRLTDVDGGRAGDVVFYDAADTSVHYSAGATMSASRRAVVGAGMAIVATDGGRLATVVADTFGKHDPYVGHCTHYNFGLTGGPDARRVHSCHDTMLLAIARESRGRIGKRDIAPNINFFCGIPFDANGDLFSGPDTRSVAGDYVELVADRDLVMLMANCPGFGAPQIPSEGAILVEVWDGGGCDGVIKA